VGKKIKRRSLFDLSANDSKLVEATTKTPLRGRRLKKGVVTCWTCRISTREELPDVGSWAVRDEPLGERDISSVVSHNAKKTLKKSLHVTNDKEV